MHSTTLYGGTCLRLWAMLARGPARLLFTPQNYTNSCLARMFSSPMRSGIIVASCRSSLQLQTSSQQSATLNCSFRVTFLLTTQFGSCVARPTGRSCLPCMSLATAPSSMLNALVTNCKINNDPRVSWNPCHMSWWIPRIC